MKSDPINPTDFPLTAGVLLGGMLLVVAICKPLQRSLHRKFFI